MIVFRKQKNKQNPYVMVNKGFVGNPILSAKAQGVLLYLLSLPDDWKVYEDEVVKHFKDGKRSIRSAIKELLATGYLSRIRMHRENGQLAGFEYTIREVPAKSTILPKRKDAFKQRNTNNKVTKGNQVKKPITLLDISADLGNAGQAARAKAAAIRFGKQPVFKSAPILRDSTDLSESIPATQATK